MKTIPAVETVAAIIALGAVGVIGYRVYRAISPALTAAAEAGKAVGNVIDAASQAVDAAESSGVDAAISAWENPECHDPNDPRCVKRSDAPVHELIDEQGNVIGHVDWSKVPPYHG